MKSLSIDIETFSTENLSRSGVYRYAEVPEFRILLFGYRIDEGEVSVCDVESGETLPAAVLSALLDDSVIKWAFNASFERVCLSRHLRDLGLLGEGEFLSPSSWHCTMIWCAYLGLPLSLAGAGAVLGLDKQKLAEGKDLIRLFCQSAKPSFLNGLGYRNLPWSYPERWKEFMTYNRRDVETECAIKERLVHYPVPDSVWEQYALDQEINDRGIRVDEELAHAAVAVDSRCRILLTRELKRLTMLENPKSAAQVKAWLEEHGTEVQDMTKKQVQQMLLSASDEVRPVLLLRQQLAKNSVKKYQVMDRVLCEDGRIRGMFQFYGAPRSGRWAGRGVQLQNLPQNHIADLDQARALVYEEDFGMLHSLYDSVPDVLSELIRTAFVPADGMKFIVADFSAIEARVIAWLAGEAWRSEVFASGGDIYCASASKMFGVPVEKHGVNGHLRQKGKVSELALGYGGGVGALKAMGALEMGVPENELQGLVDAWRTASPNIVRLWWNVDAAVKTAIQNRTAVRGNRLKFEYKSGMLFIHLPSGRSLAYVKPRLAPNRFGGESVQFEGLNAARKWDLVESYGPKFVENIVQGISRDLLCEAMLRLDREGYRIVAHVHDEVIIEAEAGDTVEEVCSLMGQVPEWADGLQLRADGYECKFYRKD